MHQAWSVLNLKSLDESTRTLSGIASTPGLDRQGDSMAPEGAQFSLPMPLLWQHDAKQPIGHITHATVTAAGIRVQAQMAPAGTAEFIDNAWKLIKAGLVRGLSIGWRPLADPVQSKGSWVWPKWEWLELSAVTIPANQAATILSVKAASGAASGRPVRPPSAGVSALPTSRTMKISEELTSERELLSQKSGKLEALMTKAQTDGGLEADETTEQAALETDITAITARVKTLSTLEAAQMAQASVVPFASGASRTTPRGAVQPVNLPKGTLFTRYAMAVAAGKGSFSDTVAYAKRFTNTPEVLAYIKATEGVAILDSPSWGSQLVNPNTMATEFVELLNPMTIIGRVTGFRMVPFNIPIITQTGGSTIGWVGEGAVKPVGELAFDRTTLTFSKVAGIVVLTEELVRLSTPSAEATVRQDLLEQAAKFLDEQFIQISVAPTANSPASITYQVTPTGASGTDYQAVLADMNTALATFDSNNIPTDGLEIVMTPALARGISTLTTPLGTRAFDTMTPSGGTLMGYRVIVSASTDSGSVVIFKPSEVFMADDGRVTLDASNQATLDMVGGSPSSPSFNLWQRNCIGIRAERWIRWQKRRDNVVAVIDSANYGPAVGSP